MALIVLIVFTLSFFGNNKAILNHYFFNALNGSEVKFGNKVFNIDTSRFSIISKQNDFYLIKPKLVELNTENYLIKKSKYTPEKLIKVEGLSELLVNENCHIYKSNIPTEKGIKHVIYFKEHGIEILSDQDLEKTLPLCDRKILTDQK
jgi:hypothetical protein